MDAEEFRRRREALGMTQAALAAALGVTRQAVYLWERHGPGRMGRVLALALERLAQMRGEDEQATAEPSEDGRGVE